MPHDALKLEFDGGSRGNPGPAAFGVVLRDPAGKVVFKLGRFLGSTTNNVAEYSGLVAGIVAALELGSRKLDIRGDSELVVKQLNGQYRVKHPNLKPLYDQAMSLLDRFDSWTASHNYREHNTLADELANQAMDARADVGDASPRAAAPPKTPLVSAAPVPVAPRGSAPAGSSHSCPKCGCRIEVTHASDVLPELLRPFLCACGARMTPDKP